MSGNILLGVVILLVLLNSCFQVNRSNPLRHIVDPCFRLSMEKNLPESANQNEPSKNSSTTTTSLLTSNTGIVKGSHSFKIRGYSLSKGIGSGKYIISESFSVGGHDWAIYYYPDGKNEDDDGNYVSLFIVLVSDTTDAKALFELTLLDQSGNERHKVHSHFQTPPVSGVYTIKCRGSMWDYKRFLKKTDLETSDYLKDDCLHVSCSVGVVRPSTEGP